MEAPSRHGHGLIDTRRAAASAALLALSIGALAQSTTRVSTSPVNTQGNYHSFRGAVSADGRYVAFQSLASNLTLTDANSHLPDIFVKDRATSNTVFASVSSGGVQGNSGSIVPAVSADGRYVAYASFASNLVSVDTNGVYDVFVRDQLSGTTLRASEGAGGVEADGASQAAAISDDGRFVAFESEATNLVPGDTNGLTDVFVHDVQTGATLRVSVGAGGAQADGVSAWPSLSADGRYVAFESLATNLVADDTNDVSDVFVRDLLAGTTTRVSLGAAGAQGNLGSAHPSISADGRWVAFQSDASNLVLGDGNAATDIFVHDLQTGTTTRVSVSSAGAEANGQSLAQGTHLVSADGRFVAFDSSASNLVTGDTNAGSDCFVRDLLMGTTERVSVATSGAQAGSGSRAPWICGDGRYVAFESPASTLVVGDNNNMWDVFLRDRGPAPGVPYCFGDGSGTACPCGNGGGPGRGCANSLNASGARLVATGTPSVALDTLALLGDGMPNSAALYFQGTAQLNGTAGAVFGDGLRCAAGVVVRLGTKQNVAGASRYPGAGDATVSVRGAVPAGSIRYYQIWYRNADPGFCTPATYNLSNGLAVTWAA
ncbi:MAG: PD40 domain-containing protein [Planctomycetes bacterium]|nr:PD40 domain-containing protein [Planctomycetota bacterium]